MVGHQRFSSPWRWR